MTKKVKKEYIFTIESTESKADFFQKYFETQAECIVMLWMTNNCAGGVYDVSFRIERKEEK